MAYGAIDLHTAHSQVRIVDEAGQVMEDRRIPTNRSRFAVIFADRPRLKVLIEASAEAEWSPDFSSWPHLNQPTPLPK